MARKKWAIVEVINGHEKIACIKDKKEWAENCISDYGRDEDGNKYDDCYIQEVLDDGCDLKEFEDKLDNLYLPGEGYYDDVDFLSDTFEKLWNWLDYDTRRIFVAEVINAA